jgi:hypothetical protein
MRGPIFLQKRFYQCIGVLLVFAFLCRDFGAAIDHSTITEVVNDVTVLNPESRKATPAQTNGLFGTPDLMKTGADSRSEMVAPDQTITRVGANTLFSFEPKSRAMNLREGSVLFQSPTGQGGGTIRTASATASVLGTTIIVVATKDGGFKLLVLEGTGRVRMPNGSQTTLHGGQLVFVAAGATEPGPVLNFLLSNLVDSSYLVEGFKRRIPSWEKIRKQILEQDEEIALGRFKVPTVVVGNIPDPNLRINQIQGLRIDFPRENVPTPQPTQRQPRRIFITSSPNPSLNR